MKLSGSLTAGLLATLCTAGACNVESSNSGVVAVPDREPSAIDLEMPTPRAGADLVGKNVAALLPERWIGTELALSGPGAAKATLIRFWTDTCRFCEASLPAVEQLRTRYGEEGLATVGVYHPKPAGPASDEDVELAARRLKYEGPVAVDEYWQSLKAIWLDTGRRSATSFSILCDSRGVVRFVHPGPEFHPSEEDDHALCDSDFRAVEAAIRVLLKE